MQVRAQRGLVLSLTLFLFCSGLGCLVSSSANNNPAPDSYWTDANTIDMLRGVIRNGDFEAGNFTGFSNVANLNIETYTRSEINSKNIGDGFYYLKSSATQLGAMEIEKPLKTPPELNCNLYLRRPVALTLKLNPNTTASIQFKTEFCSLNLSYYSLDNDFLGYTNISFTTKDTFFYPLDSRHRVIVFRHPNSDDWMKKVTITVPKNRWTNISLELLSDLVPDNDDDDDDNDDNDFDLPVVARARFYFYPNRNIITKLDGIRLNNWFNLGQKVYNGGFETNDFRSWLTVKDMKIYYDAPRYYVAGRSAATAGELSTPVEKIKDWLSFEPRINITERLILRATAKTATPTDEVVLREYKAWYDADFVPVARTYINYTANASLIVFQPVKSVNVSELVPARYIDAKIGHNRYLIIDNRIENFMPIDWWQKKVSYVRTVFTFPATNNWNLTLDLYSIGMKTDKNLTLNFVQRKFLRDQLACMVFWIQNSNHFNVTLGLKIITNYYIKKVILNGDVLHPINENYYYLGLFRAGEAKLVEIYLIGKPIEYDLMSFSDTVTLGFSILVDGQTFPETAVFLMDSVPFSFDLDKAIEFGDLKLAKNSRVIIAGGVSYFSLKVPQIPGADRIEAQSQIILNHTIGTKSKHYAFNVTEPVYVGDYVNFTFAVATNEGNISFIINLRTLTLWHFVFYTTNAVNITKLNYTIELINMGTVRITYLNFVRNVAAVFAYIIDGNPSTLTIRTNISNFAEENVSFVGNLSVPIPTNWTKSLALDLKIYLIMELYPSDNLSVVMRANLTIGEVYNLTKKFNITGSYVVGFLLYNTTGYIEAPALVGVIVEISIVAVALITLVVLSTIILVCYFIPRLIRKS